MTANTITEAVKADGLQGRCPIDHTKQQQVSATSLVGQCPVDHTLLQQEGPQPPSQGECPVDHSNLQQPPPPQPGKCPVDHTSLQQSPSTEHSLHDVTVDPVIEQAVSQEDQTALNSTSPVPLIQDTTSDIVPASNTSQKLTTAQVSSLVTYLRNVPGSIIRHAQVYWLVYIIHDYDCCDVPG